jgi:hypothetical protein
MDAPLPFKTPQETDLSHSSLYLFVSLYSDVSLFSKGFFMAWYCFIGLGGILGVVSEPGFWGQIGGIFGWVLGVSSRYIGTLLIGLFRIGLIR